MSLFRAKWDVPSSRVAAPATPWADMFDFEQPAVVEEQLMRVEAEAVSVFESSLEDKLVDAAKTGDVSTVRRLLRDQGVDVNCRSPLSNWTALHTACWEGQEKVVRLLLESKADLRSTVPPYNWAPLVCAAHNVHAGVIKLLARAGADFHAPTPEQNPLIWAAFHSDAERRTQAVEYLLVARADPSVLDKHEIVKSVVAHAVECGKIRQRIHSTLLLVLGRDVLTILDDYVRFEKDNTDAETLFATRFEFLSVQSGWKPPDSPVDDSPVPSPV